LEAAREGEKKQPIPASGVWPRVSGSATNASGLRAGVLPVGHTRRQLSFFVMVLCYSRRLYVEFTLAQTQEHFLACHQHAFEYFNGVTAEVMVDKCLSSTKPSSAA